MGRKTKGEQKEADRRARKAEAERKRYATQLPEDRRRSRKLRLEREQADLLQEENDLKIKLQPLQQLMAELHRVQKQLQERKNALDLLAHEGEEEHEEEIEIAMANLQSPSAPPSKKPAFSFSSPSHSSRESPPSISILQASPQLHQPPQQLQHSPLDIFAPENCPFEGINQGDEGIEVHIVKTRDLGTDGFDCGYRCVSHCLKSLPADERAVRAAASQTRRLMAEFLLNGRENDRDWTKMPEYDQLLPGTIENQRHMLQSDEGPIVSRCFNVNFVIINYTISAEGDLLFQSVDLFPIRNDKQLDHTPITEAERAAMEKSGTPISMDRRLDPRYPTVVVQLRGLHFLVVQELWVRRSDNEQWQIYLTEMRRADMEDSGSEDNADYRDSSDSSEDEEEGEIELPEREIVEHEHSDEEEDEEEKCDGGKDANLNYPAKREWVDFIQLEPFQFPPPQFEDPWPMKTLSPVEIFERFFDDEVCSHIVHETNRYAMKSGDNNFNFRVEELKVFIGIIALSGCVKVPRYRDYWEDDSVTANRFVSQAMRRNRFSAIKRYFHLADEAPIRDKFGKVRPLFDLLNVRYRREAILDEFLAIDESMVPYYGHHSSKQRIQGKPIRSGYRMWCLCDRNGYLIQFEAYQGKAPSRCALGVGGSIVLQLIECLPPRTQFHIFTDRFFTGLKLAYFLRQRGIAYTGTINSRRVEDCPVSKDLHKEVRGVYEYCMDRSTSTAIVAWLDNRTVHILSTAYGVEPEQVAVRWKKGGEQISITQPYLVEKYNENMGGVDRQDQNINKYRSNIGGKKWHWKPTLFCIDTAIHNSWQLYRRQRTGVLGQRDDYASFRRFLATCYLQMHANLPAKQGRPKINRRRASAVPREVRFDRIDHWPLYANKRPLCAYCDGRTKFYCEKCKIGLHIYPNKCFKAFHIVH